VFPAKKGGSGYSLQSFLPRKKRDNKGFPLPSLTQSADNQKIIV
jgi:hypothetical protein